MLQEFLVEDALFLGGPRSDLAFLAQVLHRVVNSCVVGDVALRRPVIRGEDLRRHLRAHADIICAQALKYHTALQAGT